MAAVFRVCKLAGFWKLGTKFGGGVVKFLVRESNASKTETLAFIGWVCRFGSSKGSSDGVDDPLEYADAGSNGDDESDDVDAGPAETKPFLTKLWNSDATSIGGDGTVKLAACAVVSVKVAFSKISCGDGHSGGGDVDSLLIEAGTVAASGFSDSNIFSAVCCDGSSPANS